MNSATIDAMYVLPRHASQPEQGCSCGSAVTSAARSLLVLTALAALVTGCATDDDCTLEARSRELGGAGLMDCGLASTDDTGTVDRCAVAAFKARSTFRAIYERKDGMLEALVHAAGDAYLTLRETSSGLERRDCAGAHVVEDAGRSYVECVEPSDPVAECN